MQQPSPDRTSGDRVGRGPRHLAMASQASGSGVAAGGRGFERGLATLAGKLQQLADRGLLRVEDPMLAAQQFAGMVLWVPVNKAMFCGDDAALPPAEIDRYANAGARAFLSASGRP